MTLSVNCMTRGPADRVVAMLALFRPVADEIFVAIDDRAEPELDGALASVADTLVRYPYAEPVDRPLAWIHAQCRGEWVLTVDDDEIPSRALLNALPGLVASQSCTHYWLLRRWLYPTGERYLDAQPWSEDYVLRLVRNDPRVISFPDETHVPVAALGPARYLDLPLYHADCILNATEARARKARHYERLHPGKRVAGRPLNAAFYLPEEVDPPTQDVPSEDRELIRSVLAPKPATAASAPRVRTADRAEVDRFWTGAPLADSAYAAQLTLLGKLPRLTAGAVEKVSVHVENRGDATWPWGESPGPEIRLTYRWLRSDRSVAAEGLRAPLPADLAPGESQIVPLTVAAPDEPGRYTLLVDLVHEHVRWFDASLRVVVDVVPAHIVGVLDPGTREDLLSVVEQLEPEEEPLVLTHAPAELGRAFAGRIALVPGATSRHGFLRLYAAYRSALADASRLLVPAGGRRLPLLAALAAARSLGIPTQTTDGQSLTARRILRR